MAGRFAIHFDAFHSQPFEELRHDDASHGIHRIEGHLEAGLLHSLHVHGFQSQDGIYMCISEVFLDDCTERVHIGEIEILLFRAFQNGRAFSRIQEFPFLVQEFECIPLFRVMRCCQYDTSVCLFEYDSHFRSRSGCIAGLDHVHAAGDEGTADELFHHFS